MDKEMSLDDARNRIERETEEKVPGYKGPVWGVWTPGTAGHDDTLTPLRIEFVEDERSYLTQLVLTDDKGGEKVYWVDAPRAKAESTIESSILVGDEIEIVEVSGKLRVKQVCVMISERKISTPFRKGTLMSHTEVAERRKS